jgi:hypothetical protein
MTGHFIVVVEVVVQGHSLVLHLWQHCGTCAAARAVADGKVAVPSLAHVRTLVHVQTVADWNADVLGVCHVLMFEPQLLEFSRTVLEDLSNYDPTAAWPVALDEFAEHIRRSAKK